MEHDEALLESLAILRDAHDKASRQMAEIALLGARALKGRGNAPSLVQLQSYMQALAAVQRQAAHCEELMLGGTMPDAAAGSWPHRSLGADGGRQVDCPVRPSPAAPGVTAWAS